MAVAKLRIIESAEPSTADEIKSMIASRAQGSMLDVLITPEIASMLLRYNAPGAGGTNRNLRLKRVAHWASIISDGQWVNTGEPIIMSDNETLNDGQHRLKAVQMANKPALMDIRFGVRRDHFMATGVGQMRTAADVLTILGYTNLIGLAATVRTIVCYKRGLPTALYMKVRPPEVAETIKLYPDITDALARLSGAGRRVRNSSINALVFLAFRSGHHDTVESFLEILLGSYAGGPSAAHQLHDAIWAGQGFPTTTEGRLLALAVGIQCWNAYRLGERVRGSFWRPGQPFPTVDGLTL